MDRISGAYPGGAGKRDRDGDAETEHRRRLDRAEAIEGRLHARRRAVAHLRRKNGLAVGFAVAVLLAGILDFWMGLQANRTSEEIAAELDGRAPEGFDLTRERNKVLQQLWFMEDLERAPGPDPTLSSSHPPAMPSTDGRIGFS